MDGANVEVGVENWMKHDQVEERDQLTQKMKISWRQGMWIVGICLGGCQAPYVMNSIPGLLVAKGNFAKTVFGVTAIGVFGCVIDFYTNPYF